MEQSLLGLWAQRIIGRLMKLCNTQSVLFAAGADQDAPALRKALPAAEFFLLRDGEGDTPVLKEFDRAIGRKELSPQSGFALSYIGEGLFSLPEE
jgi:hypothetical protein